MSAGGGSGSGPSGAGAAAPKPDRAVEEEVSKALAMRLADVQNENYSLKQKVMHLERAIQLANEEIAHKKLSLRLLLPKIPGLSPADCCALLLRVVNRCDSPSLLTGGALTTDEHMKMLAKSAKVVS